MRKEGWTHIVYVLCPHKLLPPLPNSALLGLGSISYPPSYCFIWAQSWLGGCFPGRLWLSVLCLTDLGGTLLRGFGIPFNDGGDTGPERVRKSGQWGSLFIPQLRLCPCWLSQSALSGTTRKLCALAGPLASLLDMEGEEQGRGIRLMGGEGSGDQTDRGKAEAEPRRKGGATKARAGQNSRFLSNTRF